ncbi:SDR family NAD(P)-dependent oxidoreductase [Mammaliicoccus sciuri]|uniref:SDR family NAD(P)-dependent oxidoreductase n=1 Tax=Mammaliicoccus sciuri TaxID=1296 RepID=A0ABT7I128_MAMSC|nr:SDR family oxidoreductase [Mammaliicoccus sciuri]MBG9206879.1 SDR family oxidoreductase [Mammaliicoccus sciuri]MDL0113672.1 SDR family NAD(P)-dependent oxidoreductase [Mammaliicoccus sciuri]MDL0118126.1 SDR family NAD(P)-dependent oxidoreductase [Mammaliicoccus sciuri]
MDLKLKGKTALVTGSTKGIGKAIAKSLANEGVDVIINGRNKNEIKDVLAEIKHLYPQTNPKIAHGDLRKQEDLEKVTLHYPEIDILINNIGIYEQMNYQDITSEVWKRYIDHNFMIADNLCKFYLPKMIEKNNGKIIFIASEEAILPNGMMPQYAVTKSMILSLAKSLSLITRDSNVNVNTVMPGPTITENVKSIITSMNKDKQENFNIIEERFVKENIPDLQLGRFIRPDEIGQTVAFMCSPITMPMKGTVLRMDGGIIPTIY